MKCMRIGCRRTATEQRPALGFSHTLGESAYVDLCKPCAEERDKRA